jgi:hypothetical protein
MWEWRRKVLPVKVPLPYNSGARCERTSLVHRTDQHSVQLFCTVRIVNEHSLVFPGHNCAIQFEANHTATSWKFSDRVSKSLALVLLLHAIAIQRKFGTCRNLKSKLIFEQLRQDKER